MKSVFAISCLFVSGNCILVMQWCKKVLVLSYDNVLVLKYDKVLLLLVLYDIMVIYWYCANSDGSYHPSVGPLLSKVGRQTKSLPLVGTNFQQWTRDLPLRLISRHLTALCYWISCSQTTRVYDRWIKLSPLLCLFQSGF
jgi:hypothetical protein